MDEPEFSLEFHTELKDDLLEEELLSITDQRLQKLAKKHSDIIGATVNIREVAHKETVPLYEATVVTHGRPTEIVGKEKADSPRGALKGALDAVERQVREKRDKLGHPWEQPQNNPVTKEVIEIIAAEEADLEATEEPEGTESSEE